MDAGSIPSFLQPVLDASGVSAVPFRHIILSEMGMCKKYHIFRFKYGLSMILWTYAVPCAQPRIQGEGFSDV